VLYSPLALQLAIWGNSLLWFAVHQLLLHRAWSCCLSRCVWGGGTRRSCADCVHCCSLAPKFGQFATGEACPEELTALAWQRQTAGVAGRLQGRAAVSRVISASWVLFCNGEAGVIYWVNLHFSDAARAVVVSESRRRCMAVLLPLAPWCPPTRLASPRGPRVGSVGCGKGSGLCARPSGLSPLGGPCHGVVLPCLTALDGIWGLPSSRCAASLSWDRPELLEEK